ncbi:MAG: Hydroxyacylglutathione hydrolase GloC [Verrucomicrobia subdivision 3 bacterium]|nr:Hydroxyacylglutathione hydrolase GloC [Limisphaerales bacterium]MCS1417826.1 Hydroxyacylglutathione hydrolase GloC [Limisphaerales bacterium]
MPLEDHAGDVIRKTRMGLDISSEEVATAARTSAEQLAEFEKKGAPADGIDFANVAERLTLDGSKLQQVAEGWEPAAHDISKWHHLRQIETDDGGMAVNCFLLWDRSSGEAALFDTGWLLKPIADLLDQFQLNLSHIFITHSHYDHFEALGDVRNRAPSAAVHSNFANAPKNQRLTEGDRFSVGKLKVSYRETPGHADDGVTYIIEGFPNSAPPVAMVGDAIFAGSIGGARNHFEVARKHIREQILTLPEGTLICPGHGPVTTVGEQRAHNPFFPS